MPQVQSLSLVISPLENFHSLPFSYRTSRRLLAVGLKDPPGIGSNLVYFAVIHVIPSITVSNYTIDQAF